MKQYLELLQHILDNGIKCKDRTGVGTLSCFDAPQTIYDLNDGLPLCTTKRVSFHNILHELLWFLRGPDSPTFTEEDRIYLSMAEKLNRGGTAHIKYLQDNKVKIWDEWAIDGDLGPLYPVQWRAWNSSNFKTGTYIDNDEPIDQIQNIIDEIKNNPWSRRLIVSAWNVHQLDKMALNPCHILFQFKVWPDKNGKPEKLDLKLYQRSADIYLGSVYNICSYSILLIMISHLTNLQPNKFIYCLGDAHLYLNHIKQAELQLTREPKPLPTLKIVRDVHSIDDFTFEDFKLENYESWPSIKAEVAV